MEQKTKDFILTRLNQGKDYSDEGTADYFGRSLFNQKTHAIVIEERDYILQSVEERLRCESITINEILDSGLIHVSKHENETDFKHNNVNYTINLKISSFGRGFIFH